MTGAGLVYFPAFILSLYLASRSYPTSRTKLFALAAHVLVSAVVVTGLVATVSPEEPGIIGLWLVIFGPGATAALCRFLVILWQQVITTTSNSTNHDKSPESNFE